MEEEIIESKEYPDEPFLKLLFQQFETKEEYLKTILNLLIELPKDDAEKYEMGSAILIKMYGEDLEPHIDLILDISNELLSNRLLSPPKAGAFILKTLRKFRSSNIVSTYPGKIFDFIRAPIFIYILQNNLIENIRFFREGLFSSLYELLLMTVKFKNGLGRNEDRELINTMVEGCKYIGRMFGENISHGLYLLEDESVTEIPNIIGGINGHRQIRQALGETSRCIEDQMVFLEIIGLLATHIPNPHILLQIKQILIRNLRVFINNITQKLFFTNILIKQGLYTKVSKLLQFLSKIFGEEDKYSKRFLKLIQNNYFNKYKLVDEGFRQNFIDNFPISFTAQNMIQMESTKVNEIRKLNPHQLSAKELCKFLEDQVQEIANPYNILNKDIINKIYEILLAVREKRDFEGAEERAKSLLDKFGEYLGEFQNIQLIKKYYPDQELLRLKELKEEIFTERKEQSLYKKPNIGVEHNLQDVIKNYEESKGPLNGINLSKISRSSEEVGSELGYGLSHDFSKIKEEMNDSNEYDEPPEDFKEIDSFSPESFMQDSLLGFENFSLQGSTIAYQNNNLEKIKNEAKKQIETNDGKFLDYESLDLNLFRGEINRYFRYIFEDVIQKNNQTMSEEFNKTFMEQYYIYIYIFGNRLEKILIKAAKERRFPQFKIRRHCQLKNDILFLDDGLDLTIETTDHKYYPVIYIYIYIYI